MMTNLELYNISVLDKTAAEAAVWREFARGIKKMFPVEFTCETEDVKLPRLIFGQSDTLRAASTLSLPVMQASGPYGQRETVMVRFSEKMPKPFRGHSLETLVNHRPESLVPAADEEVLAYVDQLPVWTLRKIGQVNQYRTTLRLPSLASDKLWSEGFHGGVFLELLPLIVWLREIVGEHGFAGPQLRACFIIDDPNLHSCRYGYVDYRAIAAYARKRNFHVAFATIPLDGWFTSRAAVDVFLANSGQLSLMIHGNNHTYKELGQSYSETERTGLVQQAINRISRLETRTKLGVSRVMAPPHGACSEEMLAIFPQNGIRGATISHGSLRSFNKGKAWTQTIGYKPSEWIHGCPVLPRWSINADFRATVLLAAYLGQPLIFMGHHQDLKGGVEWFGSAAEFINTLPRVSWGSAESLFYKSFQTRLVGSIFQIRPWSERLRVEISERANHLLIDTTQMECDGEWLLRGDSGESLRVPSNRVVDLGKELPSVVEIVRLNAGENIKGRSPSTVWPLMRRLLTEGRDRWSGSYKNS